MYNNKWSALPEKIIGSSPQRKGQHKRTHNGPPFIDGSTSRGTWSYLTTIGRVDVLAGSNPQKKYFLENNKV